MAVISLNKDGTRDVRFGKPQLDSLSELERNEVFNMVKDNREITNALAKIAMVEEAIAGFKARPQMHLSHQGYNCSSDELALIGMNGVEIRFRSLVVKRNWFQRLLIRLFL